MNPGLQINDVQKKEMEREAAKHGLGVITAAVFLAGEMAGSGVLALPFAMTGTGKNALKLIKPDTIRERLEYIGPKNYAAAGWPFLFECSAVRVQ